MKCRTRHSSPNIHQPISSPAHHHERHIFPPRTLPQRSSSRLFPPSPLPPRQILILNPSLANGLATPSTDVAKGSLSAPRAKIKVNSKDEILAGTYRTEPVPEAPKILKLTRTISSSNNAPDCGGRIGNEAGKTRSAYIVWESETEMRLCFDTSGYRCFGRFKKK